MREDMAKVLVERPRCVHGFHRGPKKGYRKQVDRGMESDDGLPSHETMKARSGGRKFFNEHLGPLRRFLNSQVGRPWHKVYAEILQHVDRGNVVQKHILTHLFEYVVVDPAMIEGVPHYPLGGRDIWYRQGPIEGRHRWYVSPKSGLLKRAPQGPTKAQRMRNHNSANPLTLYWTNPWQCCHRKEDGSWILVTVSRLPGPTSTAIVSDVLIGKKFKSDNFEYLTRLYGKSVFAVRIRPLAKWELRKFPIPIDLLRPPIQNIA